MMKPCQKAQTKKAGGQQCTQHVESHTGLQRPWKVGVIENNMNTIKC